MNTKKFRWIILVFIAPALILYTWFLAIPLINSMRMSFYTGQLYKLDEFVGFDNYIKLFTQSPFNERLLGAFLNNIEFFLIMTIVQNGIALILALILTRKFKGAGFFRTIYFIPATLSVIVVGFLFKLLLNPIWGLFDKILEFLQLDFLIRPWLGDKITALPTICLVNSWQNIGIPLILFTAGLSGINREIIEASKVDGASPLGTVRFIELPMLKPVIGVVIILTFIANFSAFDIVYAMASTLAVPGYSTDIFGTFFYRTTFGRGGGDFTPDIGLGAAVATIMFLIILVGVIFGLTVFKRKEEN